MSITTEKIIHPELSYALVGIAFKIFNETGFGMSEKYMQRIFEKELIQAKFPYERERLVTIAYQNSPIGKYFLDFVVDDKIVVELKVRLRFGYVHIKQVVGYLRATGYTLALLIYFTRDGVKYRRILNAA